MEGTKQWYLSKTLWGALAVMLAMTLQGFGYDVKNEDLTSLFDTALSVVAQVIELVGAGLALYGRLNATERLE